MSPRGPCSSSIPLPWAAALLLALGVERDLALPEVQKQVRGRTEAEVLGQLVSRSPVRGSPQGDSTSDFALEAFPAV